MRKQPRRDPLEPPAARHLAGKAARGWWPDPNDSLLFRYYDGTRWTDRTAPRALGVPGRRKIHFRHHLHQRLRRVLHTEWIWGGTVLLYLMVALPLQGEPGFGWLATVALCAVLVGPFLAFLLPASWHEFRESGGHEAGGLILCVALTEGLLVRLLPVLPWYTVAFAWVNRITVFVGLTLLGTYVITGFRLRLQQADGTYRHLWFNGVIAVVLLLAFVGSWYNRILEAFWLR